MRYEDYFSMFLSIEEELTSFLKVIDYSEKHKAIYSHKLVLLLLQTCPVIESYLVRTATSSNTVQKHPIWNCDINSKIWESTKGQSKAVKEVNGLRQISGFPKFIAVNNEVFNLDDKKVTFYHSERFQVNNGCDTSQYSPFKSLLKTLDFEHSDYKEDKTRYPKGYATPKWWTAYNKIKHSFDGIAEDKVNYAVVIEAVAALFIVLAYCEPNINALESNGYLSDSKLKSKLFEVEVKCSK